MSVLHTTGRITWLTFSALLWIVIALFILPFSFALLTLVIVAPDWHTFLTVLIFVVPCWAVIALAFALGWRTPGTARFKWPRRILGHAVALLLLGLAVLFAIIGLCMFCEHGC